MSTFRKNWAGTASTTLDNLIAGSKFEFLNRPAVIRIYACQDTGLGNVQLDLTLGNVVVGDDLPLPIVAVGTGPNRNEHLLTKGIGHPRDRIQIKLQEIAATTTPVRVMVDIDDIA